MGVTISGNGCDGCWTIEFVYVSLEQYERCGNKKYCPSCYQKWLLGEPITLADKIGRVIHDARKQKGE